MTESVVALALLLALAGLGAAAGFPLVARLPGTSRAEQLLFGVPLGLGAIAYAVLAIGWSGHARSLALWIGACVVAAAGLLWQLRGGRLATANEPPARARSLVPRWWSMGAVALLALCGCVTLIGALAPPAGWEWDSLSYHLAAPKVWLRHGRIHYLPYDHHSNFPFTWNMLYLLMLSTGKVGAAKLVHWLCAPWLAAAVWVFARRHCPSTPAAGPLAAVIVGTAPIVLWESTTAYVDLATALFVWLSVHALVNAGDEVSAGRSGWSGSLRWLAISSVAMGFALGTKMTCLAFIALGWVGIVLWHPIERGGWRRESLAHATGWATGALALGAVWYVKTWAWTGNPVYPFLYSVFGGKYWDAANAAKYAADQAAFGLGKDPASLLLAPWRATQEMGLITAARPFVFTEYVAYGLPPILLCVGVGSLLLGLRPRRELFAVLAFSFGVSAVWFFMMQQTRYLIPALPGFALVAAVLLLEAPRWFRGAGLAAVAVGAVWGLGKATEIAMPAWPVVNGSMSVDRYLARKMGPIATAERWINGNTPVDAKVALFDEPRGFWLDRDYAWAEPNHAAGLFGWERFADAEEFTRAFSERGYRWVLWNRANAPEASTDRWRILLDDAIREGRLVPAAEFGPAIVLSMSEATP
ncbi:MAG: hypothetical protein ACKO5K_11255 [Armatimonadota bacterium]